MEPWSPVVSRHHGRLGTVIELRVWADADRADAIVTAALDEIDRLQRIFDSHDPASNLNRWRAGTAEAAPELAEVLALADGWRERSGGAFDPAVGALVALWDEAARDDRVPTDEALAEVLAAMADPADERHRPSNLNALAKGWIVDRALDRALDHALDHHPDVGLTINAGGDLRHRGPRPLIVGIEDPARPYDNVAPLVRISLAGGALATSGGARRGWTIAGRRYSHVIDPRTGRPVDHVGSASVLAPDAATADVVATVLSVCPVDEGLSFVGGLGDRGDRGDLRGVGCLIVTAERSLHRGGCWPDVEL
jgi:thiamine biosynthesis lipoprotein